MAVGPLMQQVSTAGGFSVISSDFSNGGSAADLVLGTVAVGDFVVCTSNRRSTGVAVATAVTVEASSVAQISTLTTLLASTRYDSGGTSDGAAIIQYGFVTTGGNLLLDGIAQENRAATVYRGLASVTQTKSQNNGGATAFDLDFNSTPTGVVIGVLEGGDMASGAPTLDDASDWTAVNYHAANGGASYFNGGVQWWSNAQPAGLHGDCLSAAVLNGGQLVAIIEAALA